TRVRDARRAAKDHERGMRSDGCEDVTRAGQRPPRSSRGELRALALLFGRLGATAFGGPAAHIAMMEDEVVRRRKWLTREEFLDLLGATNLIPRPHSHTRALT